MGVSCARTLPGPCLPRRLLPLHGGMSHPSDSPLGQIADISLSGGQRLHQHAGDCTRRAIQCGVGQRQPVHDVPCDAPWRIGYQCPTILACHLNTSIPSAKRLLTPCMVIHTPVATHRRRHFSCRGGEKRCSIRDRTSDLELKFGIPPGPAILCGTERRSAKNTASNWDRTSAKIPRIGIEPMTLR